MLKKRYAFLVAAPLLGVFACSDPAGDEPPPPTADMSSPVMDLTQAPDLLAKCELPFDVRAIDKVSMGAVNAMVSPGDPMVYTAEVDATAGGSMKYAENPFVYIDLVQRKRVDITDVQAQNSKAWDIAIKRWQVKINSGDSGPGGVTVARVDGKTLSEVTAAPAGPYKEDKYFDDKCMLQFDPIGGIGTELSDWYDYDMSGMNPMPITPHKQTLVFTRRDGQGHIKLQILGYYKGMAGGNYSLTWGYLP